MIKGRHKPEFGCALALACFFALFVCNLDLISRHSLISLLLFYDVYKDEVEDVESEEPENSEDDLDHGTEGSVNHAVLEHSRHPVGDGEPNCNRRLDLVTNSKTNVKHHSLSLLFFRFSALFIARMIKSKEGEK